MLRKTEKPVKKVEDGEEVNKGGRPRKEIKKETFEKLCQIMCTEKEICGFFGITDKTLTRWCKETYGMGFSDIYKDVSADGKISLRRFQFKMAERNSAMAIWLGKQWLGQRDNIEITGKIEDGEEVDELNEYFNERRKEGLS